MKPLFISALIVAISGCTSEPTTVDAPSTESTSSENTDQGADIHFFSVAWGCVELSESSLNGYEIQDYAVEDGSCPSTITVVGESSSPLFTCEIVVGPEEVPASYIFYDKRSLDNETVQDLESQGFNEGNFCPEIEKKTFL